MNNEVDVITDLLSQFYGIDINGYEEAFFKKCVQNRMSKTLSNSFKVYCDLLKINKKESETLAISLNNTFSEFFRNTLTFAYLEQIVFPSLIEKKRKEKQKEIRIWSAACASGQEPYSLAILIDELIRIHHPDLSCRIFATDINRSELTVAKKGIYLINSMGKVSINRLNTYFTRINHEDNYDHYESYTISSDLKQYIDFSVFDLTSEAGICPQASIYGNFDLIFCSNVLFYYNPEYRKRILAKIGNCLNPNAWLITGEAERGIVKENNYREEFFSSGIFRNIKPNENKSH